MEMTPMIDCVFQLHEFLALEVNLARKEPDYPALSSKSVLIRGDSEAEYRQVQVILQECAKVGIWKLESAAAEVKRSEKAD